MEQKYIKYSNEKIHIPIIVPVAISILLLLICTIAGMYIMQQRYLISKIHELVDSAEKSFYGQLKKDAMGIRGMLDFVKQDKKLQYIWLSSNRQLLLNYSKSIYKNIESEYAITHFYFHNTEKINFLRVHQPLRYGDHIERLTLAHAANEKETAWGIELGPLGTVTLRVVEPWIINGSLAGYLELGKEISYIMPELNKTFKIESFNIIDKKYLNKAQWQQGMGMLGFGGDWDAFKDYVAVDSNSTDFQNAIAKIVTQRQSRNKKDIFQFQIEKKDYCLGLIPLVDAGGKCVGDIVIIKDVTSEKTSIKVFIFVITILAGVVGGFLLIIYILYVRGIESKLSKTYSELKNEIKRRTEAEDQLNQAYVQIENKVREQTLELGDEVAMRKKTDESLMNLNKQLENTIQKLTIANYELSEFTRIAAHDLKSPLRAIGSLAGIVNSEYGDKLGSQGKELLDKIVSRSVRMDKQLSSILRYSEIHRSRQEHSVDLNLLLHQMISELSLHKSIEIIIENQLPVIICESDHIMQLLKCLVDNAIKFMDKPKGYIRIGCLKQEDFWRFRISDNGPGIESKYFDKIFKVFQKLARFDDVESIGIGLPIAKKIVELYGGKIWVESEIGNGSTFFFTLPMQQQYTGSYDLLVHAVS